MQPTSISCNLVLDFGCSPDEEEDAIPDRKKQTR